MARLLFLSLLSISYRLSRIFLTPRLSLSLAMPSTQAQVRLAPAKVHALCKVRRFFLYSSFVGSTYASSVQLTMTSSRLACLLSSPVRIVCHPADAGSVLLPETSETQS